MDQGRIPREVKIPNNVDSNIEICEFLQNIYKVYGHCILLMN